MLLALLMLHPGHGFAPGHFHPSDATLVLLIAAVAIALVLMTRGEGE